MQRSPDGAPASLVEVPIDPLAPETLARIAEPGEYQAFIEAGQMARRLLRGCVIWEVNSTARGGGVAEMIRPLLGYVRGVGLDARWAVARGDPGFFRITKRIHNHLHGIAGDGGELGSEEQAAYRLTLEADAEVLRRLLRPRDIVVLHDPQTAGLVPVVRATGARVIWRCHVGVDSPNELTRGAWRFLEPFVSEADAYIFSRREHVWDILDPTRTHIIAPCIDVFSSKNRELAPPEVRRILAAAGVVGSDVSAPLAFTSGDGTTGSVSGRASVVGGPVPDWARLVVHVSRWDHLKDPAGTIEGFVEHVASRYPDAHLALVGPEVAAVSDDPEGATVLLEISQLWHRLPADVQRSVHLVSVSMADLDVNAVTINAIQRHATVVVQKSLAEGFGLTVAEAMWKSRPVVGARVGGIQDQIEPGVSGLLVESADLGAFGAAVCRLLDDPPAATLMGNRARERVRRHFLSSRYLLQYFELLRAL